MRRKEDMFSILPKMILHDIMSRLPEKDAARTSVLSKAWADTWSTFPILSFGDTKITPEFDFLSNVGDSVKNHKNFIDHVNRSLRRFSNRGLTIKEFKLSMNYFEAYSMSKDIDLWLKLACESGVEVLELNMCKGLDHYYVLPSRVVEAKSITKLVLKGRIQVDLHAIEHLISYSPLIEDITLNSCLLLSTMSRTINISSDRLKKLELSNCFKGMKEVNIDAPNLLSCLYRDLYGFRSKPIVSFLRSSSQVEINVHLKFHYFDLHNVKELIQNCIKSHNVLTSLSLYVSVEQRITRVENPTSLQVSSPLTRIKHLYLCYVPVNEYSFLNTVNILFSSCCPKTISLSSDRFCYSRYFIKFFYEVLKVNNEYNCICNSTRTRHKCWWHGLKDVKVTCSIKVDENVDFETMLESLPTRAKREYISFTL